MGHMSLARVYCDAVARQPEGFTNFHDLDIEWGDPEKYAIIRKIGQGKYSEVFQGKDVSGEEEQDVVLKVLDVVRDPETKSPAVVFEYIDAIDFKTYFPTMPDLEVRFYLYKLLEALDYAHSMGIMHRDVKPHNTVYDPQTRALRLIDWGLADFYLP